ncbi:MAG: bifunctional metallophosphatase/5'-nucleotidase [Clostridia bacterium]|nr:bifunctional metallophosphatase/5'-nucleotidase [Clostridia bacterium]
MKPKYKALSLLSILLLTLLLTGLISCDVEADPITLPTPSVTVSKYGVAFWQPVSGAVGYQYRIGHGEVQSTTDCSVSLIQGDTLYVKAVGDGVNTLDSPWSQGIVCDSPHAPDGKPITLVPPAVQINNSGVAHWIALPGATSYAYKINNGAEQITANCAVELEVGQSIAVKAIGDGTRYLDSVYSEPQSYSCRHEDSDANKACDHCSIQIIIPINLYSLNDLHGSFMDTDANPGLDEFTTWMQALYADTEEYELLLSAGDMWQGSMESSTNHGSLMTEWMNEMDFACMTLGNHEFDWGADSIVANQAIAEFPFLAINILYQGEKVDYCQPSVVVECGGVKVGIIGAIGNVLSSISGEFTDGLQFIAGSQLTKLVQDEAARLRREEGCDLIVYSIHDSTTGYDEELSNKNSGKGYVDVVFEGHSHSRYAKRDGYGVPHVQAGAYNEGVGCVAVEYSLLTNEITVVTVEIIDSAIYSDPSITDSPLIDELMEKYFPGYDPYRDILGNNMLYRDGDALCQKVAELYLAHGKQHWSNYSIAAAGGRLQTREPYSLPAGNVTYAQLFALFPFDNDLVLVKVDGTTLRSLINGGRLVMVTDASVAGGIDPAKTYYIVTDTYTAYYNRMNIVDRTSDLYARDLLGEFIASGAWGAPAADQIERISIPRVYEIGAALPDNGSSDALYFVTGTVVSIENSTYGNMYISDGENTLFVYGVYSEDGSVRFDAMANPPRVGDRITLCSSVKRYVNGGTVTIELINARLYEIANS